MKIPIFPGKYPENGGLSTSMLVHRNVNQIPSSWIQKLVDFLRVHLEFTCKKHHSRGRQYIYLSWKVDGIGKYTVYHLFNLHWIAVLRGSIKLMEMFHGKKKARAGNFAAAFFIFLGQG